MTARETNWVHVKLRDMERIGMPSNPPEKSKAQPAGPCLMVIFGASGDLTKRKLIPALYNLSRSGYLPENFAVIGFAFDAMTTDQFRESISRQARELDEAPIEPECWNRFVERLYYMQGDFDNAAAFEQAERPDRGGRGAPSHRRQSSLLSRHQPRVFFAKVDRSTRPGRAGRPGAGTLAPRGDREAFRPRSGVQRRPEPRDRARCSPRTRSTASITTWAKRPSRT